MKHLSAIYLILLASLFCISSTASAITVFDPSNFVKNSTTAIAAVKTEVTSATTLIHQIKGTIELVKSTLSLDGLARLTGLEEELGLYRDLKYTGEQLTGTIQNSLQLTRDLQANFGASSMSWNSFLNSRTNSDIARSQVLMDQYLTINQSMEKVNSRRQEIVNKLQAAQGVTQATQAVGAAIDTVIGQNQQIVAALGTQIANAAGEKMIKADQNKAADEYYESYQMKLRNASDKYSTKK